MSMLKEARSVTPVIKWAGGKRQLIPIIKSMLPETYNRYYEPFLGGGALFCDLTPVSAVINDANKKLINLYECIKDNPFKLCKILSDFQNQYNSKSLMEEKDFLYYELRNRFNKENIENFEEAALFVFLNKTGFNGLYRVNSRGLYNVPAGHKKEIKLFDEDNIYALSELLEFSEILNTDFEKACESCEKRDFVFFDSPYYDTFDSYQAGGFSKKDHLRLFELFNRLSEKNVYCLMTNNSCDYIKELYKAYNIKTIDVKRAINCNGKDRTGTEVIITNY